MKIKIYSVAEKKPPLNEEVIVWTVDEDSNVMDTQKTMAKLAIPDCEKEEKLIDTNIVKNMAWVSSLSSDMKYDDLWSYSVVDKGE